MNGIVFALGSIVFFTILCLLQRKLAIEVNNPRAMSIIFNANASVVAILIFFLTGSQTNFVLPTKTEAWIVLAIFLLNEKQNVLRKVVAGILSFIGIYLLV